MKYCQGPKCHEYKTKDRIRGPKGDKHYETRKRSHMYYNGNFCSLGCQDDWFKQYGTRAIDHYGRIHEAKRTDASGAWYKSYDWNLGNLEKKIEWAIENNEEREAIASEGYHRYLQHTSSANAGEIFATHLTHVLST